jgi:hypothetical protein
MVHLTKAALHIMTIAIAGAGIAGLYAARELRAALGERVVLIESSPRVGGRIVTARDGDDVLYEHGPWRIADTHERVLALCSELGVELHPATAPLPTPAAPPVVPGLSIWDSAVRSTRDPAQADRLDRDTGYPGQTHAASGSSPYVTEADKYWIATHGLDALSEGLRGQFEEQGGELMLKTRVVDVARTKTGYALRLSRREGHNDFEALRLAARAVVICAPPHAWREWTVTQKCRSVADAVRPASLYHVYVSGGEPPRSHTLMPLGQQIPSQYEGSAWHQAMYSAGRVADFWYRMRLARPAEFAKRMQRPLRRIRDHYWQHGFHMWRPVNQFDLEHAVEASVEPNPAELPGLYLANESHSSHQAWIEGSLEMAQRVVARLAHGDRAAHPARLPPEWVVLDGWVIDVTKWKKVHPGSAGALTNHLEENVNDLFEHVGHSEVARATAHSLKHAPAPDQAR